MRNIIRMSRKHSSLLDSLLGRVVQEVLGVLTVGPDREWYLSDLASHLRVRPSSLQRALAKLVRAGVVLRRKDGNRVYYRPDPECPILAELSSIMAKTVGIADHLRAALDPLAERIQMAFIHGSVAAGIERSGSDIDLIIVGDAPSDQIARAIRPLSLHLGRELNFTRYTPGEFASKRAARHHFLSSVLSKPKIFLIGDERNLDEAGRRETHRARAHQRAGVGRAA
jgi:DNA-binding transcriptional ArsR family regulator